MIPYKTILQLDKDKKQPLYIQLTTQFITLIKQGTVLPETKLPSSRQLALLLGVHRKTIVACYEELDLQGWVKTVPKTGTFVNADLPLLKTHALTEGQAVLKADALGFSFKDNALLDRNFPQAFKDGYLYVNDGVSDGRLAPVDDIGILYRKLLSKKSVVEALGYGSTYGDLSLRETLVTYLNDTRGLDISVDQIMITRGSQMGLFLSAQLLVTHNEYIIVGATNYSSLDTTFEFTGAKLLRAPVDANGVDTEAVESLCKQYAIKAIYITSHHHHPTTVTLSAKRRLHLLNLAKTYQFAILEDDYDYDFHYNHAPILPLASHDTSGNVIYVGSVCKTVAPVFRVGYLVGPKHFVAACAKLRRFVDRQGDAVLEMAFSNFIKYGGLDRHINKVMKIYRARRDLFCKCFRAELGDYFSFETPKGGMAIWAKLHKDYSWDTVSKLALKERLVILEWQRYDMANVGHNAIRIGFAAYNDNEIYEFIKRFKNAMKSIN
jgi:GntR family transcriptional regulator/MocR family aminotransferase